MISKSPFENYANAEILFDVPTEEFTTDDFGNPIPVVKEIKLIALLENESQSHKSTILEGDGIGSTSINFKGYLVNPPHLPRNLAVPAMGTATIRFAPNNYQTGTFKLLPLVQDPYVVATGINIITEIKGKFTVQS